MHECPLCRFVCDCDGNGVRTTRTVLGRPVEVQDGVFLVVDAEDVE
jgi:hypothetical protein